MTIGIFSISPLRQAMFHIIQSNDINQLFTFLLADYQQKNRNIFEPFIVIVPSKVMGDWLKKQVADQAGISTLVTTEFWGRYQWSLMQTVLQEYATHRPDTALRVPDVAVLSKNVMQWRLFGYLSQQKANILNSPSHPLYEFIYPLLTQHSDKHTPRLATQPTPSFIAQDQGVSGLAPKVATKSVSLTQNTFFSQSTDDQRLWQFADDMAKMFSRYMTYRADWLEQWNHNQPLDVAQQIAEKAAFFANLNGENPTGETLNGKKSEEMPDWLVAHYVALENAQRFLWYQLFAPTFKQRRAIEAQFWQALTGENGENGKTDTAITQACQAVLPRQVILFTVQQLPPSELAFMGKLAEFTDIKLLHQNPSQMFWADIVDKNWYISRLFIKPESIYLKDYGHTLLSRFGKQSREVFAMLADLSGNADNVLWQDAFEEKETQPTTLLSQLQQDILMLSEEEVQYKIEDILENLSERQYRPARNWWLNGNARNSNVQGGHLPSQASDTPPKDQLAKNIDNSLSIHACYGIVRQLEVLRAMIVGWLNYVDIADSQTALNHAAKNLPAKTSAKTKKTKGDLDNHQIALGLPQAITGERRTVSDILVLLPDIEGQQSVIEAIFPSGVGTDGYELPAKVTGVVSKDINQLWQAMTGYFNLLGQVGARFDKASVFDWLMLEPLYQSYGLSHEAMSRACQLLELAGFRRGFDEIHLASSLNPSDDDYRFSFAYAVDRLVAGVMMPQADSCVFPEVDAFDQAGSDDTENNVLKNSAERVLPLPQIQMSDVPIVAVLSQIYQTLHQYRYLNQQQATAEEWLQLIENFIHAQFGVFEQTNALNAIWAARNNFQHNLKANSRYQVANSGDFLENSFGENSLSRSAEAVSVEKLSPENLPLKFSFILSSMANELESQQVSAEPAGVITFGRIGAVRNLPYKLVVMLNLNLADFPKRDSQNRFDLMQAMQGRRGDRFREDDELGAFLDAILAAEENCWLFYNGGSVNDSHEHLPASPVQELISFFRNEVNWQTSQDKDLNEQLHQFNKAELVTQWLVTKHPALPFDRQYFYPIEFDPNKQPIDNQITQIKNSQKPLFPPAKIWQLVFEKIQDKNQNQGKKGKNQSSSLTNETESDTEKTGIQFDIWDKKQVTAWLKSWQSLQQTLNQENLQQDKIGSKKKSTIEPLTQHINLSAIIRAAQNPALHFIQSHQIHLPMHYADIESNEPIDLDNLGIYQINAYILAQLHSEQSTQSPLQSVNAPSDPTLSMQQKIEQRLQNLSFSPELPAGVSRHLVVKTQYQHINQACEQLLANIQNEDTHIEDSHDNDNRNNNSHATSKELPKGLSQLRQALSPHQNLSALEQIVRLITPCQEQRLAVTVAVSVTGAATDIPTPSLATQIVTANLPMLDNQSAPPSFWVHYLPTNGKPKHQLAFWLNHLCWQVLRHTTSEQVANEDGFSLWQFSTHTSLYLPPIEQAQAYGYLQDWLMYYQLSAQTVVVLPPVVMMNYIQARNAIDDGKILPSFAKLIAKAGWVTQSFDDYVSDNSPEHPTWALLLAGRTPLKAIAPFADTLGAWLYEPILQHLQVIE